MVGVYNIQLYIETKILSALFTWNQNKIQLKQKASLKIDTKKGYIKINTNSWKPIL